MRHVQHHLRKYGRPAQAGARSLWPVGGRRVPMLNLALLLLAGLIMFPSAASGYVLNDEAHGTYLSVFGLGSVRLTYTTVDGNVALFEASDVGVREDFDTQELLSLTANGIIFRDYSLEGEVHYDPDEVPDWNFYVKLARDNHYLLVGDQSDIFSDAYFTRYTQPFRGLTLHAEGERFGLTTFGAVTRGQTEREELTPDGTSGTYDFSNIPVVPDSDIVVLEVRNQYDPTEVLEVMPLERNVDYTIDYDSGEVTFARPVASETFRGDPIVIVVIYKGQSESRAFNTALLGSRATLQPATWLHVGVTHVSEFDRADNLAQAFDSRQEIYSVDSTLKLGDAWKLSTEYALSQQHVDGRTADDLPNALRAELQGAVGEGVDVQARYHRIERDFATFANPALDPNEQELDLAGTYTYRPDHTLKLGYSFLQDNLPPDRASATTTTHRPFVEWKAFVREHTELFSKYEYIRATDDQTPRAVDTETHTWLVGGVQDFLRTPVLNHVTLRAEYQLSDFADHADQQPDTLTHQLGVRATAEPVSQVLGYVEQRERLIYDKDRARYTLRHDISEIGVDLKRWPRFSAASKYHYRAAHDLAQDRKTSELQVFTLSSEYQIFTPLAGAGKLEVRDETFFADQVGDPDHAVTTLNAEGRLTYTPQQDLTARLRYAYEEARDRAGSAAATIEDEAELRVNYAFDARRTRLTGVVKIERDLVEAPPTPNTKTRTITYLASAARELSDAWDILAQYKQQRTELTAATRSQEVFGEIGYKAGQFLKLTVGYQHSRFTDAQESGNNYTANSIYLKLIGKL